VRSGPCGSTDITPRVVSLPHAGKIGVIDPEMKGDFNTILAYSDEFRTIGVRMRRAGGAPCSLSLTRRHQAFVPTPTRPTMRSSPATSALRSAASLLRKGRQAAYTRPVAQGIGLTRTEHMFFDPARINVVREMILANDTPGRQKALDKLLVFQREDFRGAPACALVRGLDGRLFKEGRNHAGILGAMDGLPVVIRLLDPPLHEFLPANEKARSLSPLSLARAFEALRRQRD
jgi:hypothetical protein